MFIKNIKSDNDNMIRSQVFSGTEWDIEALLSKSNSSVFQTPNWIKIMERCTNTGVTKAFYFEFLDGTHVLWPAIQYPIWRVFKRSMAMPFGLYGKPVILGEWSPKKGRVILHTIMAGRNLELVYIENPLDERIDFLLPAGITVDVRECETHILELAPSWETMWSDKYTKRIRRQVRIAEESGLTIRDGLTNQDIEKFYLLYELESREWGYGQPPYSFGFFLKLLDDSCKIAKLLLTELDGEVIAGMIYVEDNDAIFYWFGVMNKTKADKFPMYYLISHVIHEAIDRGKKYLNLGASGNLQGVRHFKEMWHATPKSYRILTFARQSAINRIKRISDFSNSLFGRS